MSAPEMSPELRGAITDWVAAQREASIAIAAFAKVASSTIEVAIATARWAALIRFLSNEDLQHPDELLTEARDKTAALIELRDAARARVREVN